MLISPKGRRASEGLLGAVSPGLVSPALPPPPTLAVAPCTGAAPLLVSGCRTPRVGHQGWALGLLQISHAHRQPGQDTCKRQLSLKGQDPNTLHSIITTFPKALSVSGARPALEIEIKATRRSLTSRESWSYGQEILEFKS